MKTLDEKAMLVKPSISQWTARKYDRKVSKEIDVKYNAHDAGRYNKVLIALEEIKKITKIAGEARNYHYFNTLPWDDEGYRILPSANFFKYSQQMQKFKANFEKAAGDFIDHYPEFKNEAKRRLNGLYNEQDYPHETELKYKFKFNMLITPVPTAKDFRIYLGSGESDRIKNEIESRVKNAEMEAMKALWHRVHEVIKKLVGKLSEEDPLFRNSLIGNVIELVEVLPSLNLTNDQNLENLRREIEKRICSIDPEQIRNDNKTKENTLQDAEDILNKMKGYI